MFPQTVKTGLLQLQCLFSSSLLSFDHSLSLNGCYHRIYRVGSARHQASPASKVAYYKFVKMSCFYLGDVFCSFPI